jgi:hypothetical protein
MYFTCQHCEKTIMGMPILLDNAHFLHKGCEEDFLLMKKANEETLKHLKEGDYIKQLKLEN